AGPLKACGGVQRFGPVEGGACEVCRRVDRYTPVEVDDELGQRVVVQVSAQHALGVAESVRELVALRLEQEAGGIDGPGPHHDGAPGEALLAAAAHVPVEHLAESSDVRRQR